MSRKSKTSPPESAPASQPEPTAEEQAQPGFSYTAWYEQNKTTFNADRQERYANDPSYRGRVLGWNRNSRKRKRDAKEQEAAEAAKARKVDLNDRKFKTVRMTIEKEGKPVEVDVYSIGALALYLNRSIQVLRLWEEDAVIPRTPHKNNKGDRFYTKEQIQEIREILEKTGRLGDQGGRQNQGLRPFVHEVTYADGTTKRVSFYKVGILASALDRTIVTVEQMEAREALPVTPFRVSSTKYRLYSLDMIQAVKAAFAACEGDIRGEENRLAFRNAVTKAWTAQGVFSAKLGKAIKVEASAA